MVTYYKSPDDSLSVDDFYKVYGYACFYKSDTAAVNEIPLEELTITLVSEGYPRELIRHLRDVRGYKVENTEDGIYSVAGDKIPIQILVTRQLSRKENLWLRSLTNKLDTRENAKLLVEDYVEHKKNKLHKAVIETIMRANQKLFEEVNGMSDIFMEIVQEKFDRKLKEEVDKEMKKARITDRITMIWKKCAKDKSLTVIANEMETEPEEVLPIYNLIIENPGKTVDEIYTLFAGS